MKKINPHKYIIDWLKNNQHKPVEIEMHIYEMRVGLYFSKGFEILEEFDGDMLLNEVEGENDIELFALGDDDNKIDLRAKGDLMNTIDDGDMEYNNDHFSIGFKLY